MKSKTSKGLQFYKQLHIVLLLCLKEKVWSIAILWVALILTVGILLTSCFITKLTAPEMILSLEKRIQKMIIKHMCQTNYGRNDVWPNLAFSQLSWIQEIIVFIWKVGWENIFPFLKQIYMVQQPDVIPLINFIET